ncbi:Armadillo-like helical [Drechmeria coniospora]|uniref:Armadillo-like helical n=1 Tax=Drechmeria coniospora TaxID=98403 RepID=A0A151GW22_DRECN|nr:Armadillo-like helical [Drechmeria coniospora]KYK61270.1 Armadillo-like helical [Drechmeria coniospora]
MDELRFRSQHSPRNETPMTSFVSPPRNGHRLPQQTTGDLRSHMPRRFTAESGRVPTLTSVTSVSMASPTAQEYNIEQKKIEYERIREQRRHFELEMQRLDQQQRKEALELAQMEEEMGRIAGHQSEPTTPPEYRDNSGFPSMFSRPNRYSTSSLASPPGLLNRPARSGSQLNSPPSGLVQHRYGFDELLPSRSVPATRRNSDDEEKEAAVRQDPTSHRSTNALHRYSMPVTKTRTGLYDMNLDQTNTTRFLFGDDEPNNVHRGQILDDNFPTLVRREDPMSLSSINVSSSAQAGDISGISSRPASLRHSLDLKYISENVADASANLMSTQNNHNMTTTPPRLQSASASTNDAAATKNQPGASMMASNANNHAQQHFHNHNASIGRIPAGAVAARGHSRDLSNDNGINGGRDHQGNAYPSIQSALQASAAPFGPSITTAAPMTLPASVPSPTNSASVNQFHGYYPANGYAATGTNGASSFGIPLLAAGMQQMNINGVNGGNMYPPQNYTGYGSMPYSGQGGQARDSQARVIQHRRQLDNEAMSRYHNMPLESFRGQIYELCKDQHGCRYLQKKLEERSPDQVNMIWQETNQHVMELMMDPFGNYLCQKLLEFCNDDERTVLIQNASQDMVRIALNQHGTRALQKMIEFVNTGQQVRLIIEALRFRVVELIQDLNGNHVIQKCLNKLTPTDAQFIFDAVGNHCVDVGTHRHGCCVLQRCIDHATGHQKLWLVERITAHARVLVQDPFGNYVVQYIIDLNEPTFTDPVVQSFKGCVGQLSRHKFSSNVIEKCLRCAGPESKDMIVEELLAPQEIERHLRDSFGNYVIQTALEFATPHEKYRLVESIRPLLPQIRNTPYGRRIQAKISMYDNRGSAASSGQATPADNTQGQIPIRPSQARGIAPNASILQNNANGGMPGAGNQNVRHNMQTYPSNGLGATPSPPGPGPTTQQQQLVVQQGHSQQPPFTQMAPVSLNPTQLTNSSTDASEPRWV